MKRFLGVTLNQGTLETGLYLILCGGLLGLSAPGIGLWFLAWVALIPIFFWLRRTPSSATCFQGGFIVGFIFHAIYLCWFTGLHPMTWLGFTPWQSLFIAYTTWGLISTLGGLLFGLLFIGYRKLYDFRLDVFLFPLLWVFGTWLYIQLSEVYVPWALLQYTQASVPLMREVAGSLGDGSIAGLILFHNTALTALIQRHLNQKKTDLYRIGVTVTAIPLLLALSIWTESPANTTPSGFPFPVAVIQGNLPIETIRSPEKARRGAEIAYLRPLQEARLSSQTLIVLPEEGIVTDWVKQNHPSGNLQVQRLQALANQREWTLALGVSSQKDTHYYNSILLIQPHQPAAFYNKSILVPFGETTPRLHGLLPKHWLEQLLAGLGVPYANLFDAGKTTQPLELKSNHPAHPISLSGLVCFELAYPRVINHPPGDILVNTSNLGWFHQHPFLEAQFLALGQIRAAQAKRPLIIAANTGISALINPQGQILQKTLSGKKAQLFLDFNPSQK